MTLLALEQLEQLLGRRFGVRGPHDFVRLERTDRVRNRSQVRDHPIEVLIVQAERRHPHVEPRPDRNRTAQKGVQPVRLHASAFRRQHRRAE